MASSTNLPTRSLGDGGPQVPRMGIGLMGLSGTYGLPNSDAERLQFLDEAFQRGETFWDTADEYGDSEDLLGKWFSANLEKRKPSNTFMACLTDINAALPGQNVFLATKFGVRTKTEGGADRPSGFSVDSTPEYCRRAIDRSLSRLGLPYVDLYYCHRLDKITPIEKTVQAMAELKAAGKIRHIGLSECSADSLRRAHAVHPITCVQVEYSPFCLDIESRETQLMQTARELGVAIVCYSPLGHGFLSGTIRAREDFSKPGDSRAALPWLREGSLQSNVAVVDGLSKIAEKKGITTAQLSLAWLLAQGDDVFPIPGTTKVRRLEENLQSLSISVSSEEEREVRETAKAIVGGRIQAMTGYAFADTPPL